jgi:hypothetical protein
MHRSWSIRFGRAILLGAAVLLGTAGSAYAGHTRPKGATPKRDSLVIAYQGCAAPDAIHAAPLAFRSCTKPKPSSPWLTVGEPSNNGLPANFVGSSRLDVCQASVVCVNTDIKVAVSLTDVRCTSDLAAASPGVCPFGALGGYTGTVAAIYPVRLTDHCNDLPPGVPPSCPAPPGLPATVLEFDFPVKISCAAPTPGPPPQPGSTCAINTTFNALLPGSIPADQRMNTQIGAVRVTDGGKDGDVGTPDNTTFVEQGVFVP